MVFICFSVLPESVYILLMKTRDVRISESTRACARIWFWFEAVPGILVFRASVIQVIRQAPHENLKSLNQEARQSSIPTSPPWTPHQAQLLGFGMKRSPGDSVRSSHGSGRRDHALLQRSPLGRWTWLRLVSASFLQTPP